jgi:hypothetical protein
MPTIPRMSRFTRRPYMNFLQTAALTSVSRYNPAVRHAFLAVLLVACGHPAEPKHATVVTAGGGSAVPPKVTPVAVGAGAGAVRLSSVVLKDIGCPSPTCVYHAGGAAYFTCLAGGAGMCFHFGGPCAPPDSCMYDAADRTYKSCAKPVEGACAHYGAACAPASKCMFDPADGLHHRCDAAAGGKCTSYGALCAP